MPTLDDDSGSDQEDELPQVVVLKSGDLTADEVKKIKDKEIPGTGAKKGQKGIALGYRILSIYVVHHTLVCVHRWRTSSRW